VAMGLGFRARLHIPDSLNPEERAQETSS
jgi:hypothetical protein